MQTKILVVDDHPIVREGLTLRLSMHPHFTVCGDAACEESAFDMVGKAVPDLVIIDISLQQGHGIQLIKRIRNHYPDVKMLALSGHDDSMYAERTLRAGALGYLNKHQSSSDLVTAVDTVLRGEVYVSDNPSPHFDESLHDGKNGSKTDLLSDRELQVFELIGRGLPSREIARRLNLSPHTVDTHRENIKKKLGLQSSAELTRAAVQWQLEI